MPTALRGDARDLPQLAGHTPDDINASRKARQGPRRTRGAATGLRRLDPCQAPALRLGVVLGVPSEGALGPSSYLARTREAMAGLGCRAGAVAGDARRRAPSAPTPRLTRPDLADLPPHRRGGRAGSMPPSACASADAGRRRRDRGRAAPPTDPAVGRRDHRLLDEAMRDRSPDIEVPLPSSLRATSLARLRDDPDKFARDLARPMPRRPSPAARFGTRFHAWVEARFGQQLLLDPDELPGRADPGIDDDTDLRELIKQFEDGPFRRPGPGRGRATVRPGARGSGGPRPDRRGLPGRTTATWSSTGRPTGQLPPTRSSWRSTASPGRSCTTWPRAGPGRLLLRAHGDPRRARRPSGPRRAPGTRQPGLTGTTVHVHDCDVTNCRQGRCNGAGARFGDQESGGTSHEQVRAGGAVRGVVLHRGKHL